MRPTPFRLGVSRLENGTEVLTPFGSLGKTYAYEPRLAKRHAWLLAVLTWIGVAAAASAVGAFYAGWASAAQTFAVFPLAFITLDCVRVLATLWLFRRAQRQHIDISPSENQRDRLRKAFTARMDPANVWRLLVPIELVFFAGSLVAFQSDPPTLAGGAAAAFLFHALVYGLQYGSAYYKGYY